MNAKNSLAPPLDPEKEIFRVAILFFHNALPGIACVPLFPAGMVYAYGR